MSYRPRSNKKPDKKILVALGIFLVGAIFFLLFRSVIPTLARPLWQGENILASRISGLSGWFSSKGFLIRENGDLKERVAVLELVDLQARASLEGYSRLLETFGREPDTAALAAAVLVHPPVTPYDIVLIDAGSREGVMPGTQVTIPRGPLLGRVEEVFSTTARVRFFSASGEKTNAVLERGSQPIIIAGQGGGTFRLILPRDMVVEVGDRILSPALDQRLLAVVEEVVLGSTDAFKEVLARSPVNIFSLRYVELLR